MKVTLLHPDSENRNVFKETVANTAAAICINKHKYNILNEANLQAAIRSNHLSVIEHLPLTFLIEDISRACLAQITRHRHFSFNVLSQRYAKVDTDKQWYVTPETIKNNEEALEEYNRIIQQISYFYNSYPEISNEDMRYILPNACYTSLIISMNARAFTEACNKRTCNKSQWEIRELFKEMRKLIKDIYPNIWKLCFPNCNKDYGCLEANPCDEYPNGGRDLL